MALGVPDILQHAQNDLAVALDQTEDRRFFLLQRSPVTSALQSVAAASPTFF